MTRTFGILATCLTLASDVVVAQPVAEHPCDQLLLAPREANGKRIGPKSCLMQETDITVDASIMWGRPGCVDCARANLSSDYVTSTKYGTAFSAIVSARNNRAGSANH